MSQHSSTEEVANKNSLKNIVGENREMQTLTQEALDEQIRGFVAPLTRQVEELNRLVQEMSTSREPKSNPRTELRTTFGTAMRQSGMVERVHRTRNRRRSRTSHDKDDETTYPDYNRRFRPSTQPEMTDPYEHLLDAITTLPSRIHTKNPRLLQTQAPTFRGTKDKFNYFVQRIKNHLRPVN